MKNIKDVRGICGDYIKLDIDEDFAEKKVLTIDTYNYGETTVELGINELDELIKTLQEAREVLSRG